MELEKLLIPLFFFQAFQIPVLTKISLGHVRQLLFRAKHFGLWSWMLELKVKVVYTDISGR